MKKDDVTIQATRAILAKLVADEDIVVEHEQIETAYFDVENRRMVLPIFKSDVPESLYIFLVGHESGHGLYTPAKRWMEIVKENPAIKNVLNIVEDARIDRMMISRLPGLRLHYRQSFDHGVTAGIFKPYDKEQVVTLPLIGKIVTYIRATKYNPNLTVPFDDREQLLVNRVDSTRTFEDAYQLALELLEDFEKEIEEAVKKFLEGDSSSLDMLLGDIDAGERQALKDKLKAGMSMKDAIKELSEKIQQRFAGPSDYKDLIDRDALAPIYFDMAPLKKSRYHVAFDSKQGFGTLVHRQLKLKKTLHNQVEKRFLEFMRANRSAVSFMVREFETRKAAWCSQRISVAPTGELDLNKVHSFKFNEDIFRTTMRVQSAKSHGLVLIIDTSSSMDKIFFDTMKQALLLTEFCRKVDIPFTVLAFGDNDMVDTNDSYPAKSLYPHTNFCLREMISSHMKFQKMRDAMLTMYAYGMSASNSRFGFNSSLDVPELIGHTPLSASAVVATEVVRELREQSKVERVNVIFLTDGEPNSELETNNSEDFGGYRNHQLVVRDRRRSGVSFQTGNRLNDMTFFEMYLHMMKAIGDVNVVSFFISDYARLPGRSQSIQQQADAFYKHFEKHRCAMAEDVSGFDQWHQLSPSMFRDSSVERDKKVKPIAEFARGKILLSKFIDLIA